VAGRRGELRRRELLDAVIASVGARGLGSRSLRDLAADAGTSHRMLVHHFGSREGLLVAVVEEVEARQAAALATLPGDPAEAAEAMWRRLADPALWPFERLFFECYARGAHGEAPFDQLLPGLVDSWLEGVAAAHPGVDPALARLGLAVTRGLLLDLVATGDRAGVDAAKARFDELLRRAPPAS
jgi:AcrR family transcriptional regulator